MRNRTSDLRIPRSDALPLSHRDSTVKEAYYEVHMTRVLLAAQGLVFYRADNDIQWEMAILTESTVLSTEGCYLSHDANDKDVEGAPKHHSLKFCLFCNSLE